MFKSLTAGALGVRGSVEELIGYAKRAGFQGSMSISKRSLLSSIRRARRM